MKTTTLSSHRFTANRDDKRLAFQRTTIRRLIELQPEFFQHDYVPRDSKQPDRSGGVIIPFPLDPARAS
jgi:hypothetical protein